MYHGDRVLGFPQHPHRGFETVTVARKGFIDHANSMGACARFGESDLQWMTAGHGIVHSEMFPQRRQDQSNPTELFQIWLNLPARSKMVGSYFSMFWRHRIPAVTTADAEGRETTLVSYCGALPGAKDGPPTPPPRPRFERRKSLSKISTLGLKLAQTRILAETLCSARCRIGERAAHG